MSFSFFSKPKPKPAPVAGPAPVRSPSPSPSPPLEVHESRVTTCAMVKGEIGEHYFDRPIQSILVLPTETDDGASIDSVAIATAAEEEKKTKAVTPTPTPTPVPSAPTPTPTPTPSTPVAPAAAPAPPGFMTCPLCRCAVPLLALQPHIASCLKGEVVDAGRAVLDAELARLRTQKRIAIAEINIAFDALERSAEAELKSAPAETLSWATHTHVLTRTTYANSWTCDNCGAHSSVATRWRCAPCDFDICDTCGRSPPALLCSPPDDEDDDVPVRRRPERDRDRVRTMAMIKSEIGEEHGRPYSSPGSTEAKGEEDPSYTRSRVTAK